MRLLRLADRPRKEVDYSKFGIMSTDDDDGDDFVDDLTPPPPQKKTKKEAKPKKDTQLKSATAGNEGKRRSLDEKLFTRDLQRAIEKSTASNELNSADLNDSKSSTERRSETAGKDETVGTEKRRQSAASATLKTAVSCPQGTQSQPDNNNDKDYTVEKDTSSSDDADSEEVSDFEDTIKRSAKMKTSDRSTKKVKTASPVDDKATKKTSRPPTKTKSNVPVTPKVGLPTGKSSHVVRPQPAVMKQVPQLSDTPYRSPLGGTSLRSPAGSTLRLGLSRRANVKPLHAMAKVTQ